MYEIFIDSPPSNFSCFCIMCIDDISTAQEDRHRWHHLLFIYLSIARLSISSYCNYINVHLYTSLFISNLFVNVLLSGSGRGVVRDVITRQPLRYYYILLYLHGDDSGDSPVKGSPPQLQPRTSAV